MAKRNRECDLCGSINGTKRYKRLGTSPMLKFVLACIDCALRKGRETISEVK